MPRQAEQPTLNFSLRPVRAAAQALQACRTSQALSHLLSSSFFFFSPFIDLAASPQGAGHRSQLVPPKKCRGRPICVEFCGNGLTATKRRPPIIPIFFDLALRARGEGRPGEQKKKKIARAPARGCSGRSIQRPQHSAHAAHAAPAQAAHTAHTARSAPAPAHAAHAAHAGHLRQRRPQRVAFWAPLKSPCGVLAGRRPPQPTSAAKKCVACGQGRPGAIKL